MLCQRRHRRAALPRRAGRRRAPAPPGPLPARRRRGHGGHHRLRHGHRQARRALRRPPGHAQEHRGLLPGDRPRRPRRPAGRRLDGLRPAGRGEPAPHDRREPGRRGVQAGDARQARRAAGAGRGHRLPPRARCWRYFGETAVGQRSLRQLRQLPVAARRSGTARTRRASCCRTIYRVQQRSGISFGAGHIMDILRGKATEKVAQYRPRARSAPSASARTSASSSCAACCAS